MVGQLQRWADERGYAVAWGPATAAAEAHAEILARRDRGEIDAGFFAAELATLASTTAPRPAGTLVMVAVPVPAHLVRFRLDGSSLAAVLPPTYVRYRPRFEEVRQDLARNGLPGAGVEHFGWPLKGAAARLGLVRYGRNNIAYAPGLGSYIQLCAFLTDAALPPREGGAPVEPALLDECATCTACVSACPTGAIDDDRVLLRGERCLTHLNEGTEAFPAWVSPRAHRCLIGCLACQEACPVNGALPVIDTGVEFSVGETRTLLGETPTQPGRAETGIGVKLAWLGQPYAEPALGRNLRALLEAGGGGR